jgi:long-chain acyl-CoA synthetase
VVGVPNPEFGEEVKAVVQLRDPAAASPDLARQLIDYCRDRISPIKCPKSVDFSSDMPRTETGKLLKRLVKQRYWPQA